MKAKTRRLMSQLLIWGGIGVLGFISLKFLLTQILWIILAIAAIIIGVYWGKE